MELGKIKELVKPEGNNIEKLDNSNFSDSERSKKIDLPIFENTFKEKILDNDLYSDSSRILSDGPQWKEYPSIENEYSLKDTNDRQSLKDGIFDKKLGNENNYLNKLRDIDDTKFTEGVGHRTPENHGTWDGERGNSNWYPDLDYTPPEKSRNPEHPYSNPENLTWREILKKYGIDKIPFKDGFPVFDDISKGTVEIDGFETGGSDAKDRNFKRADIELAKQRGCTPEEVRKWREENNYTWHECEDKRTMQKVPNEVHANVPHDGGRSQK